MESEGYQGMLTLNPEEIIGRSYLSIPQEDGSQFRLHVIEALEEQDQRLNTDPNVIRFRCANEDGSYEEIVSYNQILEKLETNDGEDDVWQFKSIDGHEGPLKPSDTNYKGSRWNLRINWENGEITWEPLSIIAKSDPITCALYASDNDLLHLEGWKRFGKIAKRQKKLLRLANQAKLQSFRAHPVYKFGTQVPNDYNHARQLDAKNGNLNWKKAEETEVGQIDAYEAFKDLGKGAKPPPGYRKITVHLVYDVKHDGRHKARLVAGGHLTGTPVDSVYSSVVSLHGLRITIFLAELNQMEVWGADVGNAYLEAFTQEKIYIIAGPIFGNREGHTLLIQKALYGLKSSGLRWWERFSDILHDMGFRPSKAEDDIWMRKSGNIYEYIARYVDDLAIVSQNPSTITETLTQKYKLKLKGTGPIDYHLGVNFFRDQQGVLCMAPKKYIDRMIENYTRMFGVKPRQTVLSPLEKGDHPELDDSPELNEDGIRKYQSLIGALQWAVSLGRFDIATAVMTMSKFRAAPREGHLNRAKRIYGYLAKMKHSAIRFRTEMPDYSDVLDPEHDWERTVYGDVHEAIPRDCPEPLGNSLVHTVYVDANLMHDITTGHSCTGVLHLLNQTPIEWYSKKQPTVETATYGSEFLAARTATEQTIDMRTTLRYLGVPISGPTLMFGDNKTVVDSGSTPKARLHKWHVLLSFHRVREAMASRILRFIYIPGSINPADLLSKAWGYQQIWPRLKALLFWEGDTSELEE